MRESDTGGGELACKVGGNEVPWVTFRVVGLSRLVSAIARIFYK